MSFLGALRVTGNLNSMSIERLMPSSNFSFSLVPMEERPFPTPPQNLHIVLQHFHVPSPVVCKTDQPNGTVTHIRINGYLCNKSQSSCRVSLITILDHIPTIPITLCISASPKTAQPNCPSEDKQNGQTVDDALINITNGSSDDDRNAQRFAFLLAKLENPKDD